MTQTHREVSFASVLQEFFCQRLIKQQNVSPQTVASYRDTFRLLLRYAEARTHKSPATLAFAELDAEFILGFLDHLEAERGNSVRSRNARLAAIRAFMRYAALCDPALLPTIQQVLAIPAKRFGRSGIEFLSREEMQAILDAPNRASWSGHRDHVMLATFYNTGARVSEITALRVGDVRLDASRCIHLHGKGRKQRAVPLWKHTVGRLKEWLPRTANRADAPLFPNRNGKPMTRFGVTNRLRRAIHAASELCPSLKHRRISPHTIRHTTALHLLQSGVDITVIALWLGHESPATTHLYIEADLAMKERALSQLQPLPTRDRRYHPTDRLLAFLEGL
jgi:site-specific recombinase XerD